MRVTVFTETHCALDRNGHVCTVNGPRAYPFWTRYLDVFTHVTVVARLFPGPIEGPAVTGPDVSFAAIPGYIGPLQFVRQWRAIQRQLRDVCRENSAFILRVPGRAGSGAAHLLHRAGVPYAVEVVADPADVFRPGSVAHPLRPVFRKVLTADLEWIVAHASAAAYVTGRALQARYPCAGLTAEYSSVQLPASALTKEPRHFDSAPRLLRIVMVGTLARLYKGPDVLIGALAELHQHGIDARVVFVGGGSYGSKLAAQAAALGVGELVQFRGRLPAGAPVQAELDAADLFVLPSRAEGLPRALIEAMARGLPCISTTVGGIPELLDGEDLVPPGNHTALAGAIAQVARDPQRLNRMAERNHVRAARYRDEVLDARRREFYAAVEQITRVQRIRLQRAAVPA